MIIGITGSSGALGRVLSKTIAAKFPSAELCPYSSDLRNKQDLQSWVQSRPFDLVIHAAAIVPIAQVKSNLAEAWDINVNSTLRLALSLRTLNPDARLLYVSTSHVYNYGSEPAEETDGGRCSSIYGMTKYAGELAVTASGLDCLIVRVFSQFGIGQKPGFLFPSLLRRISDTPHGGTMCLNGALTVRDFVSIPEVAESICHLISQEPAFRTVNICTGRKMTVEQFVARVCRALDREDIAIESADGICNQLYGSTKRLAACGLQLRGAESDGFLQLVKQESQAQAIAG